MSIPGRLGQLVRHGITRRILPNQLYQWLLEASSAIDDLGDSLGPFNTIAVGALGSGRLLDVTAETMDALEAGAPCWVLSVKDRWRWDPTSTATPDNITVCKPTARGIKAGNFIRENIPAPEWTAIPTFTAWAIDPIGGNDENQGDTVHPLKTNAEFMRRWGKKTILDNGGVFGPYSLTYTGSPSTADVLTLDVTLGPNVTLDLNGIPTITASGTISAFSGPNRTPGAQAMPTITDLSQNWAPLALLHGTITNGANAGTNFVVLKDLTGGVARISTPLTFNPATATSTRKSLSNGDTYQIHTNPAVTVGSLTFRLADSNVATSFVTTEDLTFLMPQTFSATTKLVAKGIRIMSQRTTWASLNAECDAQILSSCLISGGPALRWGAFSKAQGGGCSGNLSVFAGGQSTFDFDFCMQGPAAVMAVGQGGVATFGTVSFFDSANALLMQPDSTVFVSQIADGLAALWGTTASGYGVQVKSGAHMLYSAPAKPVINSGLGVGRESIVGGTDKLWAAIPYVEGLNQAEIVVNL